MIRCPSSPRRRFQLYAGLLALLALTACVESKGPAHATEKPFSPLQLRLYPLTTVTSGDTITFEAEVSASSPLSGVTVEVILPPQLSPGSGQLHWQGALAADVPQRLNFSIPSPPAGVYRLRATATASGGNGHLSNEAVYIIGDNKGEIGTGIELSPRTTHPTQDDRPVSEYKLK